MIIHDELEKLYFSKYQMIDSINEKIKSCSLHAEGPFYD